MSISKLQENERYRAKFKVGQAQIASRTFDTKKEARHWLAAQSVLHSEEYDPRPGKRTTVETAVKLFLEARQGSVAESTVARDKGIVGKLGTAIMCRPVGEVTPAELAKFLTKSGETAGTRNRAKITLSAFFKWTVENKFRRDNPVLGIKLASGPARTMTPMTAEGVEALAAKIRQPEYQRLIRVLGYTGLRWGEARALKVSDLRDGTLHVTRSWSEGHSEKDVKQHGERWIPIFDVIAEDLEAAIGERAHHERVFLSPRGRLINSRNLRREVGWEKIAPGYRLHDLRHSAITEWVRQGVEVGTAQRWAGHESLKTTNRYVHATGRADRDSVRRLNQVWRGSAGGPRAAD